MYYCGPAVHTLFISCARMAGDNDFIKSGKVGGWVGGNWHSESVRWYVHIVHGSFFSPIHFLIQYVYEFQYSMFSKRDSRGMKWKTNLIPSALN